MTPFYFECRISVHVEAGGQDVYLLYRRKRRYSKYYQLTRLGGSTKSCSPRGSAAAAAKAKDNDMGNGTRKRTGHIMVRVSPDEKKAIIEAAAKCDLKAPTYLRELGLGYEPTSTIDAQAFERLAQLHGDIGRVGGLLKMWLSDNSKSGFGHHLNIPELVDRLIELQKEIGEKAKEL